MVRFTYLNKPDKFDPDNKNRILLVAFGRRAFMIIWQLRLALPRIEFWSPP